MWHFHLVDLHFVLHWHVVRWMPASRLHVGDRTSYCCQMPLLSPLSSSGCRRLISCGPLAGEGKDLPEKDVGVALYCVAPTQTQIHYLVIYSLGPIQSHPCISWNMSQIAYIQTSGQSVATPVSHYSLLFGRRGRTSAGRTAGWLPQGPVDGPAVRCSSCS